MVVAVGFTDKYGALHKGEEIEKLYLSYKQS